MAAAAAGAGREHRHPVAVLERQGDAEVPLQRAADGIAGQGAQQLAAGLLAGGWGLVVGEGALGYQAAAQPGDQAADDLPGVRQRVAHAGDELGLVDLALLGLGQQRRLDLQ